ncbi:MAG: hypothetical protein ACRBBN_21320 [Methyloligellaceae bacterium]
MHRIVLTSCFFFFVVSQALAGHLYIPDVRSPERKQIMDAARVPIMKALAGQKIVFVVRKLKVKGEWAYLEAVPRLRNGGKVNYNITKFRDAVKEGLFDEWVGVLLKRNFGSWVVKTHIIGATDYPVVAWPKKFGASAEIFQ